MNYYPYFSGFPYMAAAPVAKTGIFKSLLGGIKWSSLLSGTQKTLGIVNQAIPLIKQARPVLNNAKTMFKVMNEFKKIDTTEIVEQPVERTTEIINKPKQVNGPTFFQ